MISKTSEIAVKALIYIALHNGNEPLSPKVLAESIGESPSYMSKITGFLAKAGILRSHRGVSGGVTLMKTPEEISLLEIVEACQGKILGTYCEECTELDLVCSYHQAMFEVYNATIEVLKRWTLADLADKPHPSHKIADTVKCKMADIEPVDGEM